MVILKEVNTYWPFTTDFNTYLENKGENLYGNNDVMSTFLKTSYF